MKLYRTTSGHVVEEHDRFYSPKNHGQDASWESLTTKDDLHNYLQRQVREGNWTEAPPPKSEDLKAPIGNQEVWAAGVTYMRSREARMEEAKSAGGGDFYDRVYSASRPELFFKSPPYRVVGPGANVRIRRDSKWNVPEPELTLVINPAGKIVGYTIGNDMSSRDIEG